MARTVNVAEHAARRDAILDAAERLILSNGYERLTVQDLLDDLQISKGAFYHYFDSKPAVIAALSERLVDDSERVLAPIVADGERGALDKLQRFFGEIIRWKSARQNLFVAMLPLWYGPGNTVFRVQVDRAVAKRLAPLLTAIVRQGVDEHLFATAYPEQAGAIIVALIQSLQDTLAGQLLTAAPRSPDAPTVKEIVATYGAHIEAIERYLGIPAGALHRTESRTVSSWIAALRRADTAVGGGSR
ncbi:MAG TPA: TetR/AcrR family transcriptional regulator [Mycobacterium sp.]|nr:TetR/AcrR family transcriptional regulator [Mycobacterium sp.]HUH71779.1 TetR/AcrR family transcriptional regulator [Mycobacterium sp.]